MSAAQIEKHRQYQRDYLAANRPVVNRKKRTAWHRGGWKKARALFREKLYGVTQEQYEGMKAAQNGCCPICGRNENQLEKQLGVDHNHRTGKVRGLLCSRCNMILGQLNDDPTILRRAAKYLEDNDG